MWNLIVDFEWVFQGTMEECEEIARSYNEPNEDGFYEYHSIHIVEEGDN